MSSNILGAKHFNSIESNLNRILTCELIKTDGITRRPQQYADCIGLPYELRNEFPALYNNRNSFHPERRQPLSDQREEIKGVVDELRRLNVLCVSLQYAHHHPGTLDKEIETQTEILFSEKATPKKLTKLGLLNALRCLNYQIEPEQLKGLRELTGSEATAMKFLRVMINTLALDICSELPEDKTNSWKVE